MYIKRKNKYNIYLIIIDLFSIFLTGILTFLICNSKVLLEDLYSPMMIYMYGSVIISGHFINSYHNFISRENTHELIIVLKQYAAVVLLLSLYFLSAKYNKKLMFIIFIFILGVSVTFIVRIIAKLFIKQYFSKSKHCKNIIIAATEERLKKTLDTFINNEEVDFNIVGLMVIDADDSIINTEFNGVRIVANLDNIVQYSVNAPIDDVYINIGYHNEQMREIVEIFEEMGITVHIKLNCLDFDLPNARIERLFGSKVLTVSNNVITSGESLAKRIIDFFGGLIGSVITLILCIFVVPAIKIADPGPAIFSQVRIGRNGRRFRIYKFRSMFMDAEKRKEELMKQNEMGSDMMFKMKNDPRVIPGIGNFIRKTSIDEFPQFFNILKGDMSLVGTRPPTEDEFKKYSLHHKNRLSFKPGLTGMWQVSGRSEITDFEEIVKLDTKYITEWSIGLDIKIIFKTVFQVIKGKGAE